MMICEVIPVELWDKIELHDGELETGGITYVGETLDNFIAECNFDPCDSYDELKDAMKACNVTMEFKYISRYGLRPGSIPGNVDILRSESMTNRKLLIVLDRPLSEEEKIFYDIQEAA